MDTAPYIDAASWNLRVLERRWKRAQPFSHVALPAEVSQEGCAALTAALDEEPSTRLTSEIFEVNATGEAFSAGALVQLADELNGAAMLEAVRHLSGKDVSRAKARGYAYGRGHYLLPHADRDADALRQVAFALYVMVTPDLVGGELELFHCELELGRVVRTEPAGRITPAVGTLVLFDVSDASLHQVREVTSGVRGSISGWFY